VSDVVLREVPEPLLAALRERASHHRRSVEGEVLTILEEAIGAATRADPVVAARAIHDRLAATGRVFTDSVELLREDRDR
jgi:plasmid stability protein